MAAIAMPLAAVAIAAAGPASAADPYPPPPPVLVVDRTVVPPGGTIVLAFANFGPRERVTITAGRRTLRTVQANDSGAGLVSIRLPRGLRGLQVITATGRTSGRSASVQILIALLAGGGGGGGGGGNGGGGTGGGAVPPAGSASLPNTGVPALPAGLAAGALIAAGLLAITGSRVLRRRRAG